MCPVEYDNGEHPVEYDIMEDPAACQCGGHH